MERQKLDSQCLRIERVKALPPSEDENKRTLQNGEPRYRTIHLDRVISQSSNGVALFSKMWHLLEPGGRLIIDDQFLPEQGQRSTWLTLTERVMSGVTQAPIWRLSDVLGGPELICIEENVASRIWSSGRRVTLLKFEIAPLRRSSTQSTK